jgi:metal transporter CNNM
MAPAPKARVQKGQTVGNADNAVLQAPEDHLIDLSEDQGVEISKPLTNGDNRSNSVANAYGTSPKTTFLRRSSSGADGNTIAIRGNVNDMREHLKHLGPSNLASRPKTTRYQAVKIKPGLVTGRSESRTDSSRYHDSIVEEAYRNDPQTPAPQGGEGEGLLKSAGKDASDGVYALQQGYGTLDRTFSQSPQLPKAEQIGMDGARLDGRPSSSKSQKSQNGDGVDAVSRHHSDHSSDTLGSLNSRSQSPRRKRAPARSGSITENVIEAGGIRKVVLQTNTSSGEERDDSGGSNNGKKSERTSPQASPAIFGGNADESRPSTPKGEEVKKKRRRNRKKKGAKGGEENSAAGESAN